VQEEARELEVLTRRGGGVAYTGESNVAVSALGGGGLLLNDEVAKLSSCVPRRGGRSALDSSPSAISMRGHSLLL
jgi:hypothetical protein